MLEIGKAKELKDVSIQFVSYVGKGANNKKFFLTKSAETKKTNFDQKVRTLIKSSDDPKKLVYGVVYEPNEDDPDTHDHFMNAEEIEKAAHDFVKNFRAIDKQHDFIDGAGEMVESYITPVEFILNEEVIKEGSWILVTKATEEIWEAIEKGEYTGYSMAGFAGQVIDVEKSDEPESVDDIKIRIKKDFDTILERNENNDVARYVYMLNDAIWDIQWSIDDPIERKVEIIKSIEQLKIKVDGMSFMKEDIAQTENQDDESDNSTDDNNESEKEIELLKTANIDLEAKVSKVESDNIALTKISKLLNTNITSLQKKLTELEKVVLNSDTTVEKTVVVAKKNIILM